MNYAYVARANGSTDTAPYTDHAATLEAVITPDAGACVIINDGDLSALQYHGQRTRACNVIKNKPLGLERTINEHHKGIASFKNDMEILQEKGGKGCHDHFWIHFYFVSLWKLCVDL